jgi:hypothetical protein
VLGDVASVVDVVDGATAALHGFGHSLAARETALVPELQCEADERMTLSVQQRSDGRRIDPTRHCDRNRVSLHNDLCNISRYDDSLGDVPLPQYPVRQV